MQILKLVNARFSAITRKIGPNVLLSGNSIFWMEQIIEHYLIIDISVIMVTYLTNTRTLNIYYEINVMSHIYELTFLQ